MAAPAGPGSPRAPAASGKAASPTEAGREDQSHAADTLTTASVSCEVTGSSGAPSPNSARKTLPQPMLGQPRSARPGSAVREAAIFPEAPTTPRSFMPVGHIFRGSTDTPGAASGPAPPTRKEPHPKTRGPPGAVVAPPARGRLGVVELAPQELHPGDPPPPGRRASPAARVTAPRPPAHSAHRRSSTEGRWPPSRLCGARHRAVHVEHLSIVSSRPGPTGRRAFRARRWTAGGRPRPTRKESRAPGAPAGRRARRRGPARRGPPGRAAAPRHGARPGRSAGDRRLRRAEVDDEPQVRLVEAHAERAGRDR